MDFHPSELQVIYGENESGKSSLQQFILFMLFGLPPKKRAFYRSKTSGKMGGMLTVEDGNLGQFTIERVDEMKNGAARCLLPNGEEADETWLESRLHGMTRQTYQSIFSFDQLDLTSLKTMKEADLGEVLLGIGLTGSTDIYAVEKRLDAKIGELFKPTGRKPRINQQLESLDDLYNQVQAFKSNEKKYREKKDKVAEINAEMTGLKDKIHEEKKHIAESEKILQARPNLLKLTKYVTQLNQYPPVIPFPEDGMKRWEMVKEKALPLESELAVLRNNTASYNEKHSELKDLLLNPETYAEAKQLLSTQTAYNEHVKEMSHLESLIKEQEISLKNELKNIDSKLELADLEAVSLTYQTENTWTQVYEESHQLRMDKENLNQEKAVQQKQKEELARTRKSLEENRLTSKQVDELTNRINAYNSYHDQEKANEQRANFSLLKKQKQKTSINLLIGSIIIGVLFGIYGVFQEYFWCYGVMAGLIVVGIAQWALSKRSIQTMEQLVTNTTHQPDDFIVTLEEKQEAEELLANCDEQLRQTAIIDDKLQMNKIEQIKWQERYTLTKNRSNRLEEKVSQQRKLHPILQPINVENWPPFYHTLKSLVQNKLELTNNRQQLTIVKRDKSHIEEKIMTFFTAEDWELTYETIDTCFPFLQEKVKKHDNRLRLMEQYETWIKATNEQLNTVKQKLTVFQNEQANLMKATEVETEEQFYQAHTLLEEKRQLAARKEDLMDQLGLLFSEDKIREMTTDNTDIKERQKEYRDRLGSAEQELDEKRTQLAALDADLATMETSDEHSQIMHRYDMEQAELKKRVKEWAVLKSAKEMLAETKNNYRDKYMSRIIAITSDYFAILTNHAYTNVYAPSSDQLFQVEAENQLRFTVKELSQGTKDQLYVALRIAISEVMSDTHHMPFIIDDAFVHFDELRVNNMMKLIASIAKKRQILLFTCKKELLKDAYASNIAVLSESIRKS